MMSNTLLQSNYYSTERDNNSYHSRFCYNSNNGSNSNNPRLSISLSKQGESRMGMNNSIRLLKKQLSTSQSIQHLLPQMNSQEGTYISSPLRLVKQLGVRLSNFEGKMIELSREFSRIREMNKMIILNSNTRKDNPIQVNNSLVARQSQQNLANNSSPRRPIQLLPVKLTNGSSRPIVGLGNIMAETRKNEKEVDFIDEELIKLKAEFERRCASISSKQKLQLDGIEYIIQKASPMVEKKVANVNREEKIFDFE